MKIFLAFLKCITNLIINQPYKIREGFYQNIEQFTQQIWSISCKNRNIKQYNT